LERKYGFYVMPVLHGDRFVARVDPAFDRNSKRLSIRAISTEPGCEDASIARSTKDAIAQLGEFVGASTIDYDRIPSRWRRTLSGGRSRKGQGDSRLYVSGARWGPRACGGGEGDGLRSHLSGLWCMR